MLVNVVKWMVVVIFLSVSLYNVICTIHSLFMMSSFHIQKCEDSNCPECQLLRLLIFLHSLQCKQDSCEITLCRVFFLSSYIHIRNIVKPGMVFFRNFPPILQFQISNCCIQPSLMWNLQLSKKLFLIKFFHFLETCWKFEKTHSKFKKSHNCTFLDSFWLVDSRISWTHFKRS